MTVTDAIKVNDTTIKFFDTGNSVPAPTTPAFGEVWLDLASADVGDLKAAIDTASGGTSTLSAAGRFTLTTGTGANINLSDVSGTGLAKLGLTRARSPARLLRQSPRRSRAPPAEGRCRHQLADQQLHDDRHHHGQQQDPRVL